MNELKSSQDSTSYVSLDNDALTQVFGKDKKGRNRGVGPMSTNKMKAITPITSEIESVVSISFQTLKKKLMDELLKRLNELNANFQLLLQAFFSSSQLFSPPQFSPSYASSTIPSKTPKLQVLIIIQFPLQLQVQNLQLFHLSN